MTPPPITPPATMHDALTLLRSALANPHERAAAHLALTVIAWHGMLSQPNLLPGTATTLAQNHASMMLATIRTILDQALSVPPPSLTPIARPKATPTIPPAPATTAAANHIDDVEDMA